MTPELTVTERPLPVILKPMPDELLSSWLRRHANFYGLTEPLLINWLNFDITNLRRLDVKLNFGQMARIVEVLRCDPKTIIGMTHTELPSDMVSMIGSGKVFQFCSLCHKRHGKEDASSAVLKSWLEGWRITCPLCGSPLSEGTRPRSGSDTILDSSPFSKDWNRAIEGEQIVTHHLRGETGSLASPIAMMRLLLILSWRREQITEDGYRKGWLLNEIVPGFDAEALRIKPSISKGATALVPLHLRVALLTGLAIAAKEVAETLHTLRPVCRPFFYQKRFDELATTAIGKPAKISI